MNDPCEACRPAEPEHPMLLDGGVTDGDTALMFTCFAEEFLLLGTAPERLTAMTRDPSIFASCTAASPTPPLAPVMSTVSPSRTRPRVLTVCTAVPSVQHTVAATKDGQPVPVPEPIVMISRGGRQTVHITRESLPGRAAPQLPAPALVPAATEPPAVAWQSPPPGVLDALDPDADRCAVGVPAGSDSRRPAVEGWRMLRGDETGVLLGDHILAGAHPGALVATTIVSSGVMSRRFSSTNCGFRPSPGSASW